MPLESRRNAALFASAIAVVALVTAWFLWPRPIEGDAHKLLQALFDGDVETVYQYSFAHEKQRAKISPEKLQTLFTEAILPRFARVHQAGPIKTGDTYGDGSNAGAEVDIADDSGRRHSVAIFVYQTDTSRRAIVMTWLLYSWRVEHYFARGKPLDSIGMAEAKVLGLKADMALLKALDIPGFVYENPRRPMGYWEERLRYWEGELARRRAGEEPDLTQEMRV